MMKNILKKSVASMLMALTFLAPMTNAAYAAPKGGPRHAPAPKVVRQMPAPQHRTVARPAPAHRPPAYRAPGHHHSSDAAAAVIGGLILGAIISSIAQDNSN